MSFDISFSGKIVLITGATRGIGAAIARDFHTAGAELILTGTDSQQINELNQKNADAKVADIRYVQADFADAESTQCFLDEMAHYKRIDVCINNAGSNRIDFIESTKVEDYDLLSRVNLRAPFLITRQIAGLMKQVNYGRIVNIASIWSVVTKPKRSIYSTIKFGLVGITKAVAAGLCPNIILLIAVSDGIAMAEMTISVLT